MATKTFSSVKLPNNDIGVIAIPYGTCGTAAGTAAKTVTVKNFVLETGASVRVKFTYANSVANPTLNVNGLGAKAIYWHGNTISSAEYWENGAVIDFVYNGTQFEIIGSTALVAHLVEGAPEDLNTLDELAAALKDNKDVLDTLVPKTRKVNGKELSSDITLIASDVGAIATTDLVPITADEINNLFK